VGQGGEGHIMSWVQQSATSCCQYAEGGQAGQAGGQAVRGQEGRSQDANSQSKAHEERRSCAVPAWV
jgi:hypothetical protein